MIKLVIFDGYGVVIKGDYPDTAKLVAKKFKIDEKRAYKIIYTKYFNAAAEKRITQKQAWEKAVQELNLPITGEQLKKIHYSTFGLNRKIFSFVKDFQKQKIKTLLLSKNTGPQFRDINNTFPELKNNFRKDVINTWQLGLPKASKATIKYICSKYKIKPTEIVYIDDQQNNLLEPKKLGVKTILYKSLRQLKMEIKKFVVSPPCRGSTRGSLARKN